MNKPKSNRDEVRANTLTIPMNKQEKERVQEKANEMGISMSALGRIVLNDFFKKDEFKKMREVFEKERKKKYANRILDFTFDCGCFFRRLGCKS